MSTKKSSNKLAKGAAPQGAAKVDPVQIIEKAKQGIPPELRPLFDKLYLGGMRVMFDPNSHQMMLDELDKPGPLATRISNGVITLVYLLWQKSNRTLAPQLLVPAALVFTCEAFRFLQESKDPEATAQVLGEAIAGSVQGILDRAGATQDKLPALLQSQKGGQPAAQPQQGGLLAAATGSKA